MVHISAAMIHTTRGVAFDRDHHGDPHWFSQAVADREQASSRDQAALLTDRRRRGHVPARAKRNGPHWRQAEGFRKKQRAPPLP
jgi:hypothetical protein